MPFHSHKLPNGLQLIGETSPSARSVAVGFFVRTGSRDETTDEAIDTAPEPALVEDDLLV